MRMTTLTLALFPVAALAAGGGSMTPPEPSETTTVCAEGLVWDEATQSCLTPSESTNDDSARLDDARELAYEGYLQAALDVLETMEDQNDSMVLTYYGFVHRSQGNTDLGLAYYRAALRVDPDNILARSYMGQGFAAAGQMDLAQAELTEIRTRGGRGTWAEFSLRQAISSGVGYTY
ncbi:tetratricopeptide repeat protein [Yoonia litorea]|uniref:Uncharacterized protein n=1 Tax=Yoonia litorea TaxID=1123755 RepID=A0A1I6MJX6_9RHOB|nr:hypothetical protein [Yoonia litorea]SFS15941.1 hypothetical protein SAMN05444714_1930 [Yoonia litorea]